MLYGHVETYEERVDHLLRLRDQQDRTGGFLAFIPLAFHPENTVFERRGWRHTTGAEDLKMLAVSRLMLDNIPNIKAYWIMMGMPLAAVALHFGANDVQGTVVREQIFHAAGARTETEQKVDQLVRFVREAGRVPVQRDTLYQSCAGGDALPDDSGAAGSRRGRGGRVLPRPARLRRPPPRRRLRRPVPRRGRRAPVGGERRELARAQRRREPGLLRRGVVHRRDGELPDRRRRRRRALRRDAAAATCCIPSRRAASTTPTSARASSRRSTRTAISSPSSSGYDARDPARAASPT